MEINIQSILGEPSYHKDKIVSNPPTRVKTNVRARYKSIPTSCCAPPHIFETTISEQSSYPERSSHKEGIQ